MSNSAKRKAKRKVYQKAKNITHNNVPKHLRKFLIPSLSMKGSSKIVALHNANNANNGN